MLPAVPRWHDDGSNPAGAQPMTLINHFRHDYGRIVRIAMQSLFERLDALCEGAIAVDRDARICWINDKYAQRLGLARPADALGREVEEIIPNSLMREVVRSGEPIILDIMEFGDESFVVTRMPLRDEANAVIGAIGFVLYDRLHHLKPLVGKFAALQAELLRARQKLAGQRRARFTFSDLIGSHPVFLETKRQALRAAQLDTTALLLGETGTGKEMLAQAIHAASLRAARPFIGVNVAAVPETLLESEFFGTAPGAFTGADRRARDGKFVLADGGTLFLDEIGDMPLHLQAKLLRALQEQEIEPLGSNRVTRVDVRVIAATGVDLAGRVADGRFRSDLYYRLNVLPIRLPPLRERLSDLEALCAHLLGQIALRTGLPQRDIAPDAIARLAAYDWPGNVRELRNALEQVVMLGDTPRLGAGDFAAVLPGGAAIAPPLPAVAADPAEPAQSLALAVAQAERTAIMAALAACQGRKTAAAARLGISRATLYQKIATLGLTV